MFRVNKAFNNNIVQLNTLCDEDITLVNVNKLKFYQNPIIMVTTFTIIKQDKTRILPNVIPKRIIEKMMQIYEHFKLNEQKGEAQHNKNYGGEIITALPKKWIRVHKHLKNDTIIHYDMIVKPISKTWVIPPPKPLWPSFLYLIH